MTRSLRVVVIGFGLAVGPVVKSLLSHGSLEIVGCVDPDPLAREKFLRQVSEGACFTSMADMLSATMPDVAYIATPTRTHEELSLRSFSAGVDVLVEKPIATTLEAGKRLVEAARANGRLLMVNHKRSADREVLAMRAVIRSGEIGRPRLVNRWYGTNWMYRTRAAEELDPRFGGVVLRQGSHEFDILRCLVPSAPRRVRGWVGDLAPERPGEGAYYAWIECADGTSATSVYNGYDRFLTDELTAGPLSRSAVGASQRMIAAYAGAGRDEYRLKRAIGHPRAAELIQDMYGFSFAMCDRGDVRTAPGGSAWVYGASGRQEVSVTGPAGTDFIIDELYRARVDGQPPVHDGMWGLACLELCEAVRTSARTGEFVDLHHQDFAAPEWPSDTRRTAHKQTA
jgi:phthalate 4,5-cis-dihydrodiol dehydrogenase